MTNTTTDPHMKLSPDADALAQLSAHLLANGGLNVAVASGNEHKIIEYQRMASHILVDLADRDSLPTSLPAPVLAFTSYKKCCPQVRMPEETGSTFEENALLKASAIAVKANRPALGDDSGLCVDALDGGPGLHSARYAGEGATDADRRAKMLAELGALPLDKRTAHFVCALALAFPSGHYLIFRGETHGKIDMVETGSEGFGYDPIFLSDELGCLSFGNASPQMKDNVSHRGKALIQLIETVSDMWKVIQAKAKAR